MKNKTLRWQVKGLLEPVPGSMDLSGPSSLLMAWCLSFCRKCEVLETFETKIFIWRVLKLSWFLRLLDLSLWCRSLFTFGSTAFYWKYWKQADVSGKSHVAMWCWTYSSFWLFPHAVDSAETWGRAFVCSHWWWLCFASLSITVVTVDLVHVVMLHHSTKMYCCKFLICILEEPVMQTVIHWSSFLVEAMCLRMNTTDSCLDQALGNYCGGNSWAESFDEMPGT